MPTVCELAGVQAPDIHDGVSCLPLLQGKTQPDHDHLYFEFEGQVAVREGAWKYLREEDGSEHLFNLATDPHEDVDLRARRPELFKRLKATAASEHRDYKPANVPGGPAERFTYSDDGVISLDLG